MQATSRIAYKQNHAERISTNPNYLIYNLFLGYPDGLSLREISKKTSIDINAVSGRVNDLKKVGLLTTIEKRNCKITGRLISPVITLN